MSNRFCLNHAVAAVMLTAALELAGNAAWAADVTLPSAQQLVAMPIEQRLQLYRALQALPDNQRQANMDALRQEIESLTPAQKDQMKANFQAEFSALPPEKQQEIVQLMTPPK